MRIFSRASLPIALGPVAALVIGVAASAGSGCLGNIGDSGAPGHPQKGPDGRYLCNNGPYPVQSFARRLSVPEYQNVVHDVFGGNVTASTRYPGSYGKSGT